MNAPRSAACLALLLTAIAACGGPQPRVPVTAPSEARRDATPRRRATPPRPAARAEPAEASPWTTEPPAAWVVERVPAAGGGAAAARRRPASRIELRFGAPPEEISVSPSGALWLTTSDGRSYWTSRFDAPWQTGPLDCGDATQLGGLSSTQCNRITFFDWANAIATGYLGANRDEVLWTSDAGRTWESRRFGQGSVWIYDVFVTPAGEAWMGGSDGRLYHSTDFGRTWSVLAAPFDHSSRLHRIFMVPGERRGILGALSNALRVTSDAGRTWIEIPTPLDQRATSGALPDGQVDDRIDAVGMFGGQLLVAQNERVYASAPAPVQWRPLAELTAFAVGRTGQAAFAVDGSGQIVRLDGRLAATPVPGARLHGALASMRVEGDALYAMDESVGLYRADAREVRFAAPITDGDPSAALVTVRRAGDALWGVAPHGLYGSRDGGDSWTLAWSSQARLLGVEARSATDLFVWNDRAESMVIDARSGRASPVAALAGQQIQRMFVTGTRWIALASVGPEASTWESTDRGVSWARTDHWTGWSAHDAVVLPDHSVLTWTWDGAIRRAGQAIPVVEGDVPCCWSMYFASATEGFLRGYVHHLGDGVLSTHDGGATWSPASRAVLPYETVTPFGDDALGVVGTSFSQDPHNRRELYLLHGFVRRLVYTAPEAISDVSVDPEGRVLLELDPSPDTYADTAGRHWLWAHP